MIDVRSISKVFHLGKHRLIALKNVNFQILEGEVLGLVGESGCGKSTLAKILVRLESPTSGQILWNGKDLAKTKELSICQNLQMIFQDPFSSLNPRMTVETLLQEPLLIHQLPTDAVAKKLLELVGLPATALRKFPHEFSGGQRQRIAIARALALKPKFLICDEPLSSLDRSTAEQIAALLQKLQRELQLTYLFITHDLLRLQSLSSKVIVMYLGSIVEMASASSLFKKPLHPYTQGLLASIPIPDPILERQRVRFPILGEPPSPFHPPSGCPFHPRCPKVLPICRTVEPVLKDTGLDGHKVACHLMDFK